MRASNRLFSVRPAASGDLPRLCEFAAELLIKTQSKGTGKDALKAFQHVFRHPDSGIIVVAQHKGGMCAYAYAAYEWRAEFSGESMDIVELFVEHAWRNKGVGASLIATLLDTAKQRGIRHINAQVHPGNAAIERILETAGFDPEQRTVWGRQLSFKDSPQR